MMQLRKWLFFLNIVLFVFSGFCADYYTADFMRIGVGARPLAMGSAFTAIADDAGSFYWNPGGMVSAKRFSLQVEHVPVFDGLAQYNSAALVVGLGEQLALGISWIRLGVDDIPRYGPLQGTRFDRMTQAQYRSTGEAEGVFTDTEDALMISIAHRRYYDLYFGSSVDPIVIPLEVSFGLNGKYIHQKLDQSSGSGQGLDAGFLLRFTSLKHKKNEPLTWIGIGAMFRDISRTSIIWDTESGHKDRINRQIQAGVAFSHLISLFRTRLTLSADKEFGFYSALHAGAEARFFHLLALRAGFYREEPTFGAGFSLGGVTIDYAFISHDLSNTHRISGAFWF
ncbi:hypothetical protein GF407_05865 [candidate division KSB1 bacterium]|nr:hypothetical protein [candidate division KSB1 bacterium]